MVNHLSSFFKNKERNYHMLDERKIYGIFFVLGVFLFIFFPYLTLLVVTMISSFFISLSYNDYYYKKKYHFYTLLSIFFMFSALPIVTKTNTSDKFQYSEYILNHLNENIISWLNGFSGFDFLSWFSLKISSMILGAGNGAFLGFYIICFVILSKGIIRLNKDLTFFTFFLLVPQYVYDSFYANTLRQGLAFSIFILAISYFSYKRRYIYFLMSCLSHYSFLIYFPLILLINKIKSLSTKKTLLYYSVFYLFGGVVAPVLFKYLGSFSDFFTIRVGAYKNADFGVDPVKRLIITIILSLGMETIHLIFIRNIVTSKVYDKVRIIFVFMVCFYFFTLTFEEISNRYSFNVMGFFFIYLSCAIMQIKDKLVSLFFIIILITSSFFIYIYMIFNRSADLYFGNFPLIINDSIFNILSRLNII